MAVTDLAVIIWAMRLPVGQRTFHYISAALLTTASVAYFCMASGA